jgi:hypothetical protein
MKHIIFSVLLLNACGNQKDDASTAASADVVAGGFVPTDLFQVDASVGDIEAMQVAKILTQSAFLYAAKSPKAELALGEKSVEPSCEIKQDEVILSENARELTIKYTFDDTSCEQAKSAYLNTVKVLMRIGCSDTTLADHAKKSAKDLINLSGAKDLCPLDTTQKTFVNAEYIRTGKEFKARAIGATMQSDGSPCVFTRTGDGVGSMQNCDFYRRVEKTKLADQSTTVSELLKLEARDLKSASEGRFYASGTMNLLVNQWKGAMTFKNAQTSPTYQMTAGSKSIKGSLTGGLYE